MSELLGGRYLLGAMIGTGGMADVYAAHDERLSREVAVKVLRSDLARDPSFVARFRKEALAAAGLNHPGIVSVYDSGEEPAPYIVMELVSGHTLRELIHQGERLPQDRALEIAEGILAALDFSHERGIVHRDIKPANIMITDQGVAKVMDFGIARALDDLGATLTSTWNVVGTAQYLSPEQAMGESADHRSDIYSVGCLLYEVLTGRPPYTGDTPVSIAFQHVSGDFIKPRSLNPELSEGIDILLAVALAKKPMDRYQSAADMLADVRKLRAGQVVTTKIARRPVKKGKIVAWLLALLLVAGGLSYTVLSSGTIQDNSLVELPNVVGFTQVQANSLLMDFTVTFQHAHDVQRPKDLVSNQEPLAGTKVRKGSGVVVTISDGPGDVEIPTNIVGMLVADARAALRTVGLVIARTEDVASDKPAGTVIAVIPDAGSTVAAGDGVVLQIANGVVEVPSLIGVQEVQAKTVLTQGKFQINILDANDPTQANGVVLAQAPDAGNSATIGSSVTITVNRIP